MLSCAMLSGKGRCSVVAIRCMRLFFQVRQSVAPVSLPEVANRLFFSHQQPDANARACVEMSSSNLKDLSDCLVRHTVAGQDLVWSLVCFVLITAWSVAAVRGADLSKHIAGHTLLACMWQKMSPVLDSFIGDTNQRGEAREGALRELRDVLVTKESSSTAWKRLTADACAARHSDFKAQDQQMSHDAKLVMKYPLRPCLCMI